MNYLIIISSLNQYSRSRILAQEARQLFAELEIQTDRIDLQLYDLPLCDGGPSFKHPKVLELKGKISRANALLIAAPVYN